MVSNKFIAIIPARAGSKEIKKKNIVKVCGHPIVSYSIEAAKKSKFIKSVYVSTDGKDIARVSKKYGARVILRPKNLASDTAQIEPTILHAINYIEKNYNEEVHNIVLLQPTSLLRNIHDIDNAIKKFLKEKADSLFSFVNLHTLLWRKKKSKVFPIIYNPFKRKNRDIMPQTLIENGSIYITKKKIYKKLKNRVGGKITGYPMDHFSVFQVDSKNDLKFISSLMHSQIKKIYKIVTPKKK